MDITFFEAGVPLRKTFYLENGEIQTTSYPMVKNFTSYTYEIEHLEDLYNCIVDHAAQGHCLVKGKVSREIYRESRAGLTAPQILTQWICLDFDGLKGYSSVNKILVTMGLSKYSHIIQYSASMGVKPDKGLSAHVFFMLDSEVLPATLKEWLKAWNFSIKNIRESITLTRDKNQIRWPLDISVCQNDKLIYIAPAEVETGVIDSFKGDRIQYIEKSEPVIKVESLGLEQIIPAEIRAQHVEILNALRTKEGLQARTLETKQYRSEEVVAHPDKATITGLKEARGFVYLNLNGGDSWAYYHPIDNPHIIRNFKHQEAFATKDLLPDYYDTAKERAREFKNELEAEREKNKAKQQQENYQEQIKESVRKRDGFSYFVANDRAADVYYTICYDHKNDELDLERTASRQKLFDFMAEHGEPEPDFIPNWVFEFDFSNSETFRPEEQWINVYKQPTLLRDATAYQRTLGDKPPHKKTEPPTLCKKVISHVLGNDKEVISTFYNWLAYLIQRREPPRTAWIIQGRQGTGKGTLFNYILSPIIGTNYCTPTSLQALETQFNGWLKHNLLVLVDESEVGEGDDSLLEKMKTYITEPTLQLRAMRTEHKKAPNFNSFIIASNKKNKAWKLEDTDRRHHVAPYQNEQLKLTRKDIETIETELPQFLKFIMEWKVDADKAIHPADNDAKEEMKHVARTAIDSIALALHKGDMFFFLDHAPMNYNAAKNDVDKATMIEAYRAFIDGAIEWHLEGDKKPYRVHRDRLQVVVSYLIGKTPDSPNKFTSTMKHHDIKIEAMRIDGKRGQGFEFTPVITEEFTKEWDLYLGEPEVKTQKKVVEIKNRRSAK